MKKSASAILVLALVLAGADPRVDGWSLEVHQFIMGRAVDLLPPPIKPFFDNNRSFLMEHTIDPDLWRNAGFEAEPPRHFVDMDAYGAFPFAALPEDYDRAVETFGVEFVERNGLLPWRASEMFGRLRRGFASISRSQYGLSDVKSFSAWTAHYVSDGYVPFHAVLNYNGQLTGQEGIHARFEGELFSRFKDRLAIQPGPLMPLKDLRSFMFQTLRDSFRLADVALKADRAASEGRAEYDDAYYEAFFAGTRDILERRIGESITAVASVIAAAWEEAGRPVVPLEVKKTVEKVKKK